ncbi:PAAR domain-containing protein [Vibrio parahaemolyticus]|uniref:PAAR domain-containing protein n=1 Tax=Vibrio parahaemolyticus TaxID=670 RepID=UPI00352905B1
MDIINGRKIILKKDTTNTGGTVLSGSAAARQKEEIACVGDPVYCPSCDQTGSIAEGDCLMKMMGIPVALEGHKVTCGCSGGCVLVAAD